MFWFLVQKQEMGERGRMLALLKFCDSLTALTSLACSYLPLERAEDWIGTLC